MQIRTNSDGDIARGHAGGRSTRGSRQHRQGVLRIDLQHRVCMIRRRMRIATDKVAAARRKQLLESVMKQRVMGLALGQEDLNDHDDRRHAREKLTSQYQRRLC